MASETILTGDGGDETGLWVYCVADAGALWPVPEPAGIRGGRLEAVGEAGLAAYVSPVRLAEFGEQALRHNLEDLDWLAGVARAHHAVIEALAPDRPVVPMRLATVCRGRQGVRQMLARRADALRASLERVRSRREWGVKVYAAEAVAGSPGMESQGQAGAPAAGEAGSAPGAAYLRRRRAQLSAGELARATAAASAEAVHAELSRMACAARLHPPQARQLTGARTPMLVNGAYLVDESRDREFVRAVETLTAKHLSVRVELTGPWPPYSFAGVAEESL